MKKFTIFILLGALCLALAGCTTTSTSNTEAITDTKTMSQSTPQQTQQDLKVETLVEGTGQEAKKGDRITVNYVGRLANGYEFDSSYKRNTPFTFLLGEGFVIEGWDVGLLGIKIGEKRKLTIPPELGYGEDGSGPIPGNSVLIFEVELLSIE